jgi:hypothetical protein
MAGLVPAIHVLAVKLREDVDARDKRGHDVPYYSARL